MTERAEAVGALVEAVSRNDKRYYCLDALRRRGASIGRDISRDAKTDGFNRTYSGSPEWADTPLRWLRERGLVEYTGKRDSIWGSKIQHLTDLGREVLARVQEEPRP